MIANVVLPPLPLNEWEQTKKTLQLYVQVIGKIRLKLMPYKNHWWHVPLYVNPRGLGTGAMPFKDKTLEINFDFCAHQLIINTSHSEVETIELRDGLCVSEFYKEVFDVLGKLGIAVKILAKPYMFEPAIPFGVDKEHCTYQQDYVHNFWQILCFVDSVFKEFSGRFIGKCSPVHLFWHSFDLAVTRFSGRQAPSWEGESRVDAEAYSHEVISAGFWGGDDTTRQAAFYSYTYPSPAGLSAMPLLPSGKAKWIEQRGSPLALYTYDDLRNETDAKTALLQFLQSSFQAGANLSGWDIDSLLANARH
jgi:hypothetical protein